MRIVIHSKRGEALPLALKLKQSGHQVWMVIADADYQRVGDGLVEKSPGLLASRGRKPDIYYFHNPGHSGLAVGLREAGYKVVGGNMWADTLETEREFAYKMANSLGIQTPKSYFFSSVQDALYHMKNDVRRWVIRAGTRPAFSTSDQKQQDFFMLRLLNENPACPVMLQEYVAGNEVYTESWFHQGKHVFSIGAFENRRMMDGDLGPITDPQSTVAWSYQRREPRIVQLLTKKLFPLIERASLTGVIGARAILSNKDSKPVLFKFLASSPRNISSARAALLDSEFEDILRSVVAGRMEKPEYRTGYGYSVAVSVPPYPAQVRLSGGHYIGGVEMGGSFRPCDVAMWNDEPVTAGLTGLVGDTIGYGDTIEQARKQAVRSLDRIVLANKQYRRGGSASRFELDLFKLGHFGYEVPAGR